MGTGETPFSFVGSFWNCQAAEHGMTMSQGLGREEELVVVKWRVLIWEEEKFLEDENVLTVL